MNTKSLKLTVALIFTAIIWGLPAQAKNLDVLKAAAGKYHVVTDNADGFSYCNEIEGLSLEVAGTAARVTVKQSVDTDPEAETYSEINTGKYFQRSYVNGVTERFRYVFENNELKSQSFTYAIFPIGKYKDNNLVLRVVDANTLQFHFSAYGDTMCIMARTVNE